MIGGPVYDIDTATAARSIAGHLIANDVFGAGLATGQPHRQLSRSCWQEVDDVIACETFVGTGWSVGPFRAPGDSVPVGVTDIGHLDNRVVAQRHLHDAHTPVRRC